MHAYARSFERLADAVDAGTRVFSGRRWEGPDYRMRCNLSPVDAWPEGPDQQRLRLAAGFRSDVSQLPTRRRKSGRGSYGHAPMLPGPPRPVWQGHARTFGPTRRGLAAPVRPLSTGRAHPPCPYTGSAGWFAPPRRLPARWTWPLRPIGVARPAGGRTKRTTAAPVVGLKDGTRSTPVTVNRFDADSPHPFGVSYR